MNYVLDLKTLIQGSPVDPATAPQRRLAATDQEDGMRLPQLPPMLATAGVPFDSPEYRFETCFSRTSRTRARPTALHWDVKRPRYSA
jgi:hypothetical protein